MIHTCMSIEHFKNMIHTRIFKMIHTSKHSEKPWNSIQLEKKVLKYFKLHTAKCEIEFLKNTKKLPS
jgi:hypothetical protein